MRRLVATSLVVLFCGSAWADEANPGQLEHAVAQAFLYLKMNKPLHARRLLRSTVTAAPGKSDARTWLALARAYHVEQRLDAAGRAFHRAMVIGVDDTVRGEPWVRELVELFSLHVGSVEVVGDRQRPVELTIALAAPMLDEHRRRLLSMLEGFTTGVIKRPIARRFFLPAGVYKIGGHKVTVKAGEHQQLTLDQVQVKEAAP